jgi:hypothetical protein
VSGSHDLQVCIHESRITAEDDLYVAPLEAARDLMLLDLTHLLPSYFSLLRTGGIPFETAYGLVYSIGSNLRDDEGDVTVPPPVRGPTGMPYRLEWPDVGVAVRVR